MKQLTLTLTLTLLFATMSFAQQKDMNQKKQ